MTCDGSRTVGLFWRDVLGWALVWDRGEQTAVQSPLGGTKVAWDRWATSDSLGRDRQGLDLTTAELAAEVERLVALGATRPEGVDGVAGTDVAVELTDPDGNEFRLRAG